MKGCVCSKSKILGFCKIWFGTLAVVCDIFLLRTHSFHLVESEKKLLEIEKQHAAELEADRKAHQEDRIASIVRVMQEHAK